MRDVCIRRARHEQSGVEQELHGYVGCCGDLPGRVSDSPHLEKKATLIWIDHGPDN